MDELTTASASVHVRACLNCARAKAKCIPSLIGGKCSRCDRLNKDCQPAVPIRKKRTAKKNPSTSTTRLEEKLDGLFSLLKSAPHVLPSADDSAQSNTPLEAAVPTAVQADAWAITQSAFDISNITTRQYPTPTASDGQLQDRCDYAAAERGHNSRNPLTGFSLTSSETKATDPRTGRLPDTDYNRASVVDPSSNFFKPGRLPCYQKSSGQMPADLSLVDSCPGPNDAEDLLNFFRTHMLEYFPFMKMPAYDNANQFRAEYPVLWLSIMAITSKSSAQQVVLGKAVRSILGRKMLVESERSLDLLFGILVFTGWAQSHVHTNPIITNLIQLGIGLVADLGLNRQPPKSPHKILEYDARGCPKPFNPPKRTMEERRAAVGLFWLTSIISTYFQRLDSPQWNSYLEDCLALLGENGDCTTDALLVYLVRLRLLTEKALEISSYDNLGVARSSVHAPISFYMKTLLAQLDAMKQGTRPELLENKISRLHFYSTELTIHEIALSAPPSISGASNFEQAESLFACLQAIKNWYDLFFQIPPATYVVFSMSVFTQLAHCIITLYRISTFEGAGWDCGLAKETVDLSVVLGEVVKRMRSVKRDAGLDVGILENLDVYGTVATRLQTIKEWWDAKVSAEAAPVTETEETGDEMMMNLADDEWLKDMLGMEDNLFDSYMQTL